MDPVNVPAKFEVPEIIAGILKLWALPEYAVQGHPRSLILIQSKARMRLPISPS